MLTPYHPPPEPDTYMHWYNKAMIPTRTTIERCFGILKGRWQCLKVGLRYCPEMACKIILSCAVLHNLIYKLNESSQAIDLEYYENYESDDGDNYYEEDGSRRKKRGRISEVDEGKIYRERIAKSHFAEK